MKIKLVASLVIAGGLSLAMAGTASAAPLGHSAHPKPKPKPKHAATAQLTGKQLAAALLPGSDFGSGYTLSDQENTGKNLRSAQSPQNYTCGVLGQYLPDYGQTAEANVTINAPSNISLSSSDVVLGGNEDISQFANNGAAWSLLMAAQNAYRTCRSYSGTIQGTGGSGSATVTVTTQSVNWTTVGSYSAFSVSQSVEFTASGESATVYFDSTMVNAGQDDYTIFEMNTANDNVPGSLLSTLIKQTQALYK
jgi:hypothetical protein